MPSVSFDHIPGLDFPGALGSLAAVFFLCQLVVILIIAFAVKEDARVRELRKGGLFLVGPWSWFFIVLMTGGYLAALAYWTIHYSALRYKPD